MKRMKLSGLAFLILAPITQMFGQNVANKAALLDMAAKEFDEFQQKKAAALIYAQQHGIPVIIDDGITYMELMYIDASGKPQYYITDNATAAASISTNKVNPGGISGYNLDGNGMTVHLWDAGRVLNTHQEFGARVIQMDNTPSSTNWHSTHVAGTIVASGVDGNAKGMAPAANLNAYDWSYETSELATAGANGALVSNHSYGIACGWQDTTWSGNTAVSTLEDFRFGRYGGISEAWDQIAQDAPHLLICKSAGNDRDDIGIGPYPPDGPYDCITPRGVAKNVLTVASVHDIPGGYTQPSDVIMTPFSSWGPADDGRIKPDISANGVSIYSTDNANNSAYASITGSSISSSSVSGSLILLQEHYKNLKGNNNFMFSSTLKALVIHTADEAGPDDGPDYQFGWGLMNTYSAAALISDDDSYNTIEERLLHEGGTFQRTVTAAGDQPLKVTIVWTDVPGTPPAVEVDPPDPMVVNELDLRITESTTTYYPWKLDKDNPAVAATRDSENNVDNVEMVTIDNPAGGTQYTIIVDHDGILTGGSQAFSLIVTGITPTTIVQPSVAEFSYTNTNIPEGQSVTFFDESTNNPTSWSWSFPGGTPSTSTLQNPSVIYDASGQYNVSLVVNNGSGSPSTIVKTIDVNVSPVIIPYCESSSTNYSKEYIKEVAFGGINNLSGGSMYSDFTNLTMNVMGHEFHQITLTPKIKGARNQYWRVWIDYNRDGDFDDPGELRVSADNTNQIVQQIVWVAPYTGTTRMRVSMQYNAAPGPCDVFTYGEVEDYTLNILPYTPPLPPVANFEGNPTTVTVGNSVDFTDLSQNNPSSWDWSFAGGTPASSTAQNPSVTYNAVGTYAVSLTVTNNEGSNTKTLTNYITVEPAVTTNYCGSSSQSNAQEWIAQVDIDGFSNSSWASLYSDFTEMTVNLTPGSSPNVTLTPGYSGNIQREFWRIWIDFNGDNDFEDEGEQVLAANNKRNAISGTMIIPPSATGQTRMRVSMKNGGSPGPCETFSYGEVEDYTVDFMAVNPKSISQTCNNDLVIFPNPTTGSLTLAIEKDISREAELRVYDMRGSLVFVVPLNQSLLEVDLNELRAGVYQISVINGNEYYYSKLVKE